MLSALFTPADQGAKKSAREAGALKRMFQTDYDTTRSQDATQTGFFGAGRGQMLDDARRNQAGDASMAAGRGMTGGAFELAQAAGRQSGQASQLRGLLSDSEQFQAQQQEMLRRALLGAQAMRSSSLAQGDAARGQAMSNLFQTGARVAAAVGTGGASEVGFQAASLAKQKAQ